MSKSKAKRARLQQAAASGASVQAPSREAKKSQNAEKPSKLQDINCDVLFEIARHLEPMDLLNLGRTSKHLRQMLMSKSVRWLWSLARSNAKPLPVPEPPRHVSEPQLASILFEMNCSDCRRKGNHDHIDYGIGVRLCRNCWDNKIKSGDTLALEAPDLPRPLIYQLNIRETRCNKTERSDSLDSDKYYQPQFEAVVDTYKRLKDGNAETLQGFITERLDTVKGAREANTRFLKWHGKVKEEELRYISQVGDRRFASIKQKLYDLGYTDEDFPAFQWDAKLWNYWNNTVKLRKELTDKAWCDIRPQLERIILEYRNYILHDTSKKATDRRIGKRTAELRQHYKQFIDSRSPGDGPYPTFQLLKVHDGIPDLLAEDHGRVILDSARFETRVIPLVEKLKAQGLRAMVDAARAHYTKVGEDMAQISEDDSMKLLHRATSLFKDPFGFQDDRFYGFTTLMERMRSQHIFCEMPWSFYTDTPTSEKYQLGSATAAGILKMLGLPPDTPYEVVAKKVICTCGRPDFTQPAEFSELVKHVESEWAFCEALRQSRHETVDINLCPCDHDINGNDVFAKLLENDETPPTFSADKDLCDRISASSSYGGLRCKVCIELVTGGVDPFSSAEQSRAPRLFRGFKPEELAWHVAYKHKRPATADDVFIPHQEEEDTDEDSDEESPEPRLASRPFLSGALHGQLVLERISLSSTV